MSLVKTSLLNGISVAVKVASAMVLNKILAVYVGPAGYAIIGQFQNVFSILASFAAGGLVVTGVTKATAQHFDNEAKQHAVWKTAIRFSLGASVIAGIGLIFLADKLTQWLLHRADMSTIFIWIALTLPAMAANNLLMSVINGKKEVGILVASTIIGSIVSMIVTGLLAFNFGLYGALVAFTINPAIAVLTTITLVARRHWFKVRFFWGQIERGAFRELSGFGLMGLTSALTVPVSYMLIRDHLVTNLGLTAAGYWQASWKLSEIYLVLVTTTLSVYYLPRLAEIRTAFELKTEITKVYRLVLPIVVVAAAAIYLLRDLIIRTMFTTDFLPMRVLFAWQLAGDVIKIGSWILGYILIGRAMVSFFIITEIVFSASFYALSWILVDIVGLVGVSMAYAINYSLHWVCMAFLVAYEMRRMKKLNGPF